MRKSAIAAAVVLAVGATAIAVAQPSFDTPPEDPSTVSDQASAFGKCVSDASEAGAENPTEVCADLKPGANGDGNGEENGNGNSDETYAAQCAGESKEDGSFGKCVSELASSFGKCVSANAKAGVKNPAAACAEEFPGRGNPGGNGTAGGPPEGVTTGKPEGTPSGKPSGTPGGKPDSTPAGKPDGVPSGKPGGTPGGGPGS